MKRFKILLLSLLLFNTGELQAEEVKKVLIMVSNMIDMGDLEKHEARNDLFEVAPPYHVFVNHGYDVDFVSPQGGEVHFMREPLGIISYTIKYEGFLEKTKNTLSPNQVNPSEYWGVFTGGGYGVMFDVANNTKLQSIIAKIYESGGVVGVGGHGSAPVRMPAPAGGNCRPDRTSLAMGIRRVEIARTRTRSRAAPSSIDTVCPVAQRSMR